MRGGRRQEVDSLSGKGVGTSFSTTTKEAEPRGNAKPLENLASGLSGIVWVVDSLVAAALVVPSCCLWGGGNSPS